MRLGQDQLALKAVQKIVNTRHTGQRMKVLIFVLILMILCLLGGGALWFFWGYVPVFSLQWVAMPELRSKMREICGEPHQLYPPTSLTWPFPLYSPDGRYYVEIADSRFRRAEELRLFLADTNQLVGTYSYFNLKVYCWEKDSNGIYVADYNPGDSSLFIPFSRPSRTSQIKKLLVP